MRNIRDIKVGDTVIYSVSDGDLIFEKNVFFNTQSDADWKPYPDYHAPTIGMNVGSFLIHTERNSRGWLSATGHRYCFPNSHAHGSCGNEYD